MAQLNEIYEFENCEIIFRNFEGRQAKFNAAGKRNFCLILTDEEAESMSRDGWNVKSTTPKREDDPIRHYIKVNVNMDSRIPPKIYLIAGRRKTLLTADTVKELDYAEIKNVDAVIYPYHWETDDGKEGLSAYLSKLYVEIIQDRFEEKYFGDEIEE